MDVQKYKILYKEGEAEISEKKSIFIAHYVVPALSAPQALASQQFHLVPHHHYNARLVAFLRYCMPSSYALHPSIVFLSSL